MRILNFFLQMSKYNHRPAALSFNYHNRGYWGRKFNCDWNLVFKNKTKNQ